MQFVITILFSTHLTKGSCIFHDNEWSGNGNPLDLRALQNTVIQYKSNYGQMSYSFCLDTGLSSTTSLISIFDNNPTTFMYNGTWSFNKTNDKTYIYKSVDTVYYEWSDEDVSPYYDSDNNYWEFSPNYTVTKGELQVTYNFYIRWYCDDTYSRYLVNGLSKSDYNSVWFYKAHSDWFIDIYSKWACLYNTYNTPSPLIDLIPSSETGVQDDIIVESDPGLIVIGIIVLLLLLVIVIIVIYLCWKVYTRGNNKKISDHGLQLMDMDDNQNIATVN